MRFAWPRLMTQFYKVISNVCSKARLRVSLRTHWVHLGSKDGYVYPSKQT